MNPYPVRDVPFRGGDAMRDGRVSRHDLRTRYRRVFRDVYLDADVPMTASIKARAVWLSTGATLCGVSAAAAYGTRWLDPDAPAEVVRLNPQPQKGMRVCRYRLADDEVGLARGMRATTEARTAYDLGRLLELTPGVQHIDALMNATGLQASEVAALIGRYPGARGVRQLARTLEYVDGGAESPYESLTRLLLVQHGFPRPQTQIPVRGPDGRVFARIDMGWPEYLVGVEFEGKHHWTDPRQRDWDVERYAKLADVGWHAIRVTARILHGRRAELFERVGAALISRGCPKSW